MVVATGVGETRLDTSRCTLKEDDGYTRRLIKPLSLLCVC